MGENDQLPPEPDFAGDIRSGRQWRITILHALVVIWLALLLLGKYANAQAVRFDTSVTTVSAQCAPGKQCPVLSLPGTIVSVCGGSVSTLTSCLASPATTYTDFSGGTPCPTTAQLTPQTGGACLSTADAEGNAGFWALPGQYNYFLRVPATAGGGTYGPYPINVGASAGCPLGATCDASFSTLALGCTAAGTGTLYLTRTWSGLTTQTFACNIQALANGIIKPASGQTVTLSGTFTGTLTRHVDTSSGGLVVFSGAISTFYPQWFGALCDGSSVDTASLQAAIVATGARNLVLPGKGGSPCVVGSPGLILYPTNGGVGKNSGITLSGQSVFQNYNGAGGGLIAYVASAPVAMLTVYAQNVDLENLFIDCNSTAATYGVVSVMGLNSIWNNVATRACSSDGARVDMFYTPSGSIVSGGLSGSSVITLDSVTNGGICTFGNSSTAQTCAAIVFGYGTANQEAKSITSVSGNVVTISGTLSNNQTTYRAQGNNNTMRITGYQFYSNGGWGFHEVSGSDNNGIVMAYPSSKGNALGGELWENGSVNKHYGGNYEGDTGPAIQLGTTAGTSGTAFGFIGPLGDVEEATASGGINSIVSVCDNQTQVQFNTPDQLIIRNGADACSTYPSGTATIGIGTGVDQNSIPSTLIKTAFGVIPFSVYSSTTSGRCKYPGELIFVPTGVGLTGNYQYCVGATSLSISNTTNASPAVLTTSIAPTSGFVYISGYIGSCKVLNGPQTATNISSTTFSVTVDTTSLGSCAGTPVFRTSSWSSTVSPFIDTLVTQSLSSAPGLKLLFPDSGGGGVEKAVFAIQGYNGGGSVNGAITYASVGDCITDNTATAESGCMFLSTRKAGTLTHQIQINANGTVRWLNGGFTVSTLPSCSGAAGMWTYVTDASSPTYNGSLTGSSTTVVPVFCNGSSWTSH